MRVGDRLVLMIESYGLQPGSIGYFGGYIDDSGYGAVKFVPDDSSIIEGLDESEIVDLLNKIELLPCDYIRPLVDDVHSEETARNLYASYNLTITNTVRKINEHSKLMLKAFPETIDLFDEDD